MKTQRLKTVNLVVILSIFLTPGSAFSHGNHSHGDGAGKKGSKTDKEHEESSFSLMAALGVSVSKPITQPPSSDPNADDKTVVKLHGDDDHGGSGGGSSNTDAAYGPYALVGAGYKFIRKFSLDLSESVSLSGGGISDPALGVSYSTRLGKSVSGNCSLSATAPVSQASKDTFKITTVSLGGGPRLGFGKFSLGANASMAMSWYSKTVIVEEGQKNYLGSTAMLHGDDGDTPQTDTTTIEGTGNREFNRYSLKALAGYRLTKSFRFDSNAGISFVKKQFGAPYWSFDATILQISFMIL